MTDYISRQAAIDFIDAGHLCNPNEPRWSDNDVVNFLKRRPSAQQWIPCSERLPEEEDIYLVTFDKSNLLDNEAQVSDAYWINNQWQYGVLESYEHRMPKLVVEPIEELKVIAWMPLPPSFKEE